MINGKKICLAIGAACAALAMLASFTACGIGVDGQKTRISVSGAWALYPMMVKWAEEYNKENNDILVDVSAGGAGKGVADALSGMVDIGMVSREINRAEIEKGLWWVTVVKDAVVPTINASSPAEKIIRKRGLRKEEFSRIWISGTLRNWKDIIKGLDEPIRVYTRSDACGAAETWASYIGGAQEDLKGIGVYGDPGLAETVRKDVQGVGYNNINFVYDLKTRRPVAGIKVIPIDVNGNGTIDANEANYETLTAIVTAIGEGRFPSPPARGLHLVSRGVPGKPHVRAFLAWILNRGQEYVGEAGYIALPPAIIKKQEAKLAR